MKDVADSQEALEGVLKDEILRMYQEIADDPSADFHFYHGREAAELFGYDASALDTVPAGSIASFAGVGNPHLRAAIQPGETVLDLGSGAGMDAILAAQEAGLDGTVIGIDMNPVMCRKAEEHAAEAGVTIECRQAPMENLPVEDDSVDLVISNGVINLSFRKRRVIEELFRITKPGGRISITDIVSGKQLSQNIVNDPKLWAS